MKIFNGCKKEFTPLKSFHFLCNDCVKHAVKCTHCSKVIFPNKKNKYVCCGNSETKKDIEFKEKFNRKQVAKALSPMFELTNSHWNEDDEDFTDIEGLPNHS